MNDGVLIADGCVPPSFYFFFHKTLVFCDFKIYIVQTISLLGLFKYDYVFTK